MLNTNERPKSPRSTLPRKITYCSHNGRSRPKWRMAAARASCVESGEISTSIGLPMA
jgi:hypothetical protein